MNGPEDYVAGNAVPGRSTCRSAPRTQQASGELDCSAGGTGKPLLRRQGSAYLSVRGGRDRLRRYLRNLVVAGLLEITVDARGVTLGLAVVAAAPLNATEGFAFR